MDKIRLQKYLADAGIASRRKAEKLIVAGRVSVNGEIVAELGAKVLPCKDKVALDGKTVQLDAKPVYIMLHKPEGVITSVSDPYNRPVVLDFIQDIPKRLFPIGRLDYDSSGLLILTNDGWLAYRLTHPRHSVSKTYIVDLSGVLNNEGIRAFKKGIIIDGNHKTAPAQIKILDTSSSGCTASITICEGRNRQIRKMCQSVGCSVLKLKRVSVGSLKLGKLPKGQYRYLTKKEVETLLT